MPDSLTRRQAMGCALTALLASRWSGVAVAVARPVAASTSRPTSRPAVVTTRVERNLEYVAGGGGAQSLDLYLPSHSEGPVPVIVWVHGGAWDHGNKSSPPGLAWVPQGYALASINYRFSDKAVFPAQIHDCKAAVRFLRANAAKYNLDPDRFAAWGASAGAHLAVLLGTSAGVPALEGNLGHADQSSGVQLVVDWYGPTDFSQMSRFKTKENKDSPRSPESRLIGGALPKFPEKVAAANPITYIARPDQNFPPFLIMHGDRDTTVPFNQSELLASALRQVGGEVMFCPISGAGHDFNHAEVFPLVRDFLDTHLKLRK